ncbi:MAG TPA: hypothetical protein VL172_04530 [Kofleriaceae bacterium]|nr:hypothetical protein [Kofleriaceae bacterium]
MRRLLLVALVIAAGCGDFETPSIVLDLRTLGAIAEPPEVVAPFDPADPEASAGELQEVSVCVLPADPTESRRLEWNMVACAPRDSGRCDDASAPFVDVGFGFIDDPEASGQRPCGTVPVNAGLIAVLQDAVSADSLAGFGGIAVQVEIWLRPEGATTLDDGVAAFAAKRVLYAPKIPAERVANRNPTVERFTYAVNGGAEADLPLGRCEEITPLDLAVDDQIQITPVEPDGVREDYVLPTFDGGVRQVTEYMSYAWYATAGDWSREDSGGPRDLAGNQPPLDSKWTAAIDADTVGDGLDVRLWMVQRDERGGQSWYESCLHVHP